MTVDFGRRLSRYPENPDEDAHAYYERTLNSLSEHIGLLPSNPTILDFR
jgi:hypothetical protein